MDQYLPSPLSNIRHDDLLERYNIIRKVGEGAYGVVYKATPKNSEDEVAIKIIKHLDDKLVRSRTLREIKILHHLCHDNITALVDTIRPYDLTRFSEGLIGRTSFRLCHGQGHCLYHSKAQNEQSKCTWTRSPAPSWRACHPSVKVAEVQPRVKSKDLKRAGKPPSQS